MITSGEMHSFEKQELNLYRLLHCMKNSEEDVLSFDEFSLQNQGQCEDESEEDETKDCATKISSQYIIPTRRSYQKEQIELAVQMLTHLQEYVHQLLLSQDEEENDDDHMYRNKKEFKEDNTNTGPSYDHSYHSADGNLVLEDIQRRLDFITNEVKSTCQFVSNHEMNISDVRGSSTQDESKTDFYDELFGSDSESQDDTDHDIDGVFSIEDDLGIEDVVPIENLEQKKVAFDETQATSPRNTTARTNHNRTPKPSSSSKVATQDDDEKLQHEISAMAEQLKQSTLHINSTLSTQNVHLDTMETLAQTNLDSTKDVTDNVTEHNKQYGWKKTTSRWLVFFLVLISFIICFWIVRIIPKRSEACIFNCSQHQYDRQRKGRDDHRGREDTNYAQQRHGYQSQEDENRQAAHETSSRTVDPKYSFCKDASNNEAQSDRQSCTIPQNLKVHSRSMERVHEQIDGFDGAEGFALKSKVKRYHTNLERAKLEHDDIAKNRVKDGWDENVSIVDGREETTNIIDSDTEMDDDDAVGNDDYYYADDQPIDDDDVDNDDYNHADYQQIDDDVVGNNGNTAGNDDYNHANNNDIVDNDHGADAVGNDHDDDTAGNADDQPIDEDAVGNDDDDDEYYYSEARDEVQETEYDDQSTIYLEASHAAAIGDSFKLQEYFQQGHLNVLYVRDANGWQIIHEVARSGDVNTMEIILSHAEYKDEMINARTGPDGDGWSVVQLAREFHGIDHPFVLYLEENGAV